MNTAPPRYPLSPAQREQQRREDRDAMQQYRAQGMSSRKARTQVWYDRHIGRFNQ